VDGQLAAWQVQTLRLTAFPGPSAQIIEPTWWRDLRGEEPEIRSSSPRKGGLREEGPFADGNLILGFQPMRIDWLYAPISDEKEQAEGFLTIGSLDNAITTFAPLMNRWFELDTCPPVQRLAFGAIIMQPVEDLRTGYRRLMQYLRSVRLENVNNASDFLYQINLWRDSGVIPDLRINRLSKWSVASWQTVSMHMIPAAAAVQGAIGARHYACRLELDINTVPEFQGEFERGQLSPILKELIDFAVEIANRGEIP
jgi:hypothetical protein